MPKFKGLVVETWANYREVEVEAPTEDEAHFLLKQSAEDDSWVDYRQAKDSGLEYQEVEVLEMEKISDDS
jgi:hypothetical protein